jgi:hypothetical protein
MNAEPTTVREFVAALIAERGGPQHFSQVQKRLCDTIALALRDPSKVDPATVARLLDLLPPRPIPPEVRAPIPTICFVDGYQRALEAAIAAAAPDDVAATALRSTMVRIGELECERDALLQSVASLRRVVEHGHVPEGMVDALDRNNCTGGLPSGNAGHAANVVRFRDERHSLAMNTTIDQRYPSGLQPVT